MQGKLPLLATEVCANDLRVRCGGGEGCHAMHACHLRRAHDAGEEERRASFWALGSLSERCQEGGLCVHIGRREQ